MRTLFLIEMHVILNSYALILSVSGLATIIMSFIIYRRLKPAERSFALVIGLAGWWAVTYGAELFSTTLSTMLFWLKLEYLGIALMPPALLLFIRVFISKDKWFLRSSHAIFLIIPILTIAFVYTNDMHHYYYKSLVIDNQGHLPLLRITPSFWYYIFTIYFYASILWSIYSLITAFTRVDPLYKKQKNIILYALIVPWIFNIFYMVGIRPHQNIDLTPFAFIATSMIISFGLLRYKLLDIIPAAREKVFESMQDGVLVLDTFEKVVDNNLQMGKVMPSLKEKITGYDLETLFPLCKKLTNAVAERKKQTLEIEVQGNDGKTYFEVDINILSDRNENYSGSILIFHSITRRKKSAISLVLLNELKDRLFSIIAHDLRSPLINITDMVNLIEERAITEKEFKLYLPQLKKNLYYTSGLLDNLLHWSKKQLKGEVINQVRFDIKEILNDEIFYFQQKALEKGIFLTNSIEDETWVYADIEMIQLVTRNLIGNSIKYCSKEDHIIISSTYSSKEEVIICIKDTGRGMTPEFVEKIFLLEHFTTRGTNNEQGTGLGLQICKDFIEKNNGKIWVTTEPGIGSKFYFSIPKAASKIPALLL